MPEPTYQTVGEKLTGFSKGAEDQAGNWFNRPSHHRTMIRGLDDLKRDVGRLAQDNDSCKREKQQLANKRDDAKAALDRIIEHLGRCFLDGDSGQALAEARIARANLDC